MTGGIMFISQIKINNFRNFKNEVVIDFNPGINVIIGENNSGKSNLLKALSLLFDSNSTKRLDVDDFNKNTSIECLKREPPKVTITALIDESQNEEKYSDDLVTVSTWLIQLEKPYKAQITYIFSLPEKEHDDYRTSMNKSNGNDIEDYWRLIKYKFIRKYIYKLYVGNPEFENVLDSDSISKFDFQFLDAIRDVERDLFTGKNTLLREVLDFFMDYDIKISGKDNSEQQEEIDKRKNEFSENAKVLVDKLKKRMVDGKNEMLEYASSTGASISNSMLDFDGHILDTELYSALKLILEYETGIKIPASRNGLGYNNLIYISLLLAKMQKDARGDYLGSNAKIFPILAIEEPEAHLHPSMQYKFLKFLKDNQKDKARQIFITTHSPNIASAVDLDEILILQSKDNENIKVSYPGLVLSGDENKSSKAYVRRFLDVTKSDMLFAKRIIFVEGIAEQLLVSIFAKIQGINIEDKHIAIINVGGRYFDHFLKLFCNHDNGIYKKVACLTDLDPMMRKDGGSFEACYPFELNTEDGCEYKSYSNDLVDKDFPGGNVRVFSQEKGRGKTFEYELVLANPCCDFLITDSLHNSAEIADLMNSYNDDKSIMEMLEILSDTGVESKRIRDGMLKLKTGDWEEGEIKKHLIAARYLNSVNKGENALEIASKLEEKLGNLKEGENVAFNVPNYIKDALLWITE